MLEIFHITTGKERSFTLGVGRKAYNTRDIVAPKASKPSAPYSFATPQDGKGTEALAEPISTSPTRPEKPQQRQTSKLREREWLSGPALARHLGLGKKKFTELFKAGLLPHRSYPPKDTIRFNIRRVEKALAKFDVEARACSGDGPASKARRGLWAKLDAPLGIAPRFTVSETVVLLLHYRAKSGVARLPEGNRTTIYWRCFIPMLSASEMARHRVPGPFPRLHRNQVSARRCILYS